MAILSEAQIDELAEAICGMDAPLLVSFPAWFYELSETEQCGAILKACALVAPLPRFC